MRIGTIKSIDTIERSGFIVDENDQEIPFCIETALNDLCIAERVSFEIELTKLGLAAVQIQLNAV